LSPMNPATSKAATINTRIAGANLPSAVLERAISSHYRFA